MNLYISRLHSLEKIISRLKSRIDFLNKRSGRFSFYRLMVFITGTTLSITGYFISLETGWIITFISLAAFSIVVHCHNKLLEGIRRCYTYLKIKEVNLARMNVDWEKIPDPIINAPPEEMTTEKDLDLVGKNSLHNLLDVAISFEGSLLLRKWITNYIPGQKEILEKQKIIKELSALTRFRDKFILKARLISKRHLECSKISDWITGSENIQLPKWLLPASSVIISYILLFVFNSLDLIPSVWILVFMVYFLIYSANQKKIGKIIEESVELESQLKKLTSLIVYIEKHSFEKYPELNSFMNIFKKGKESAASELKSLQKIISALLIRENPIFRIVLNVVFPYDIYYSKKLITVKSDIQKNISVWMEKLNELECYISLANFSYLNPDYVFPEIITEAESFEVKTLGHPLLKRVSKVCNDFSFDKENEIVLITGSNMSGKSTFLRSAGVNLCLAYAGAPVNAEKFRISLYELFTCIKVTDSVIDGISYFYAEVKRLKQLLDEFNNDNGLKKFFLIDEIFKGTNNKERLIGSRSFIMKLSELKGTGFISTHDLELVHLEEEIVTIENYHFKEEIVNGKMEFDYKIHPGPCPTTNALKIMEMSGLPVK
ncbi:MAG: hypothetical protein IPL53_22705 [Ignavibacteria bacterium]|nr:hypothetical protein [Ignavibacteria bacterium]